ncbi:MAG: peptidoglycan-binding protein [Alphaproteobacteria bacterium]
MKRLVLTAVLLIALGAPAQAQTPEAAGPNKELSGDEETSANSDRIQPIQTYLNALGYDAGPADGVLGKRAVAAIRAFETEQGLARAALETRGALTLLLLHLMIAVPDLSEGVTAYKSSGYATALRVFRARAALGRATAQYYLGIMYDKGKGVPQDYAKAIEWYTKAAEQGMARAQYNVGVAYDNGEGVLQDYAEAKKWYTKAAEQGYAKAQSNLGTMYGTGEGVPEDYVRAHMWYNLAVAQGNETARENRDLRAEQMTPADISKA